MIVRILLSVGLLTCLVAVDTESSHGHNITRFIARLSEYGNGTMEFSGVYIYKNGNLRKLLDEGAAIAPLYKPNVTAYIGAKDGIYYYDDETEKVKKYGTINEGIISIAGENNTDNLYIVTEDHVVYKVTDGGTKKAEIEEARGARRVEVDWDGNLYFIGEDKQLYVVAMNGVKKIQGLPPKLGTAALYKVLSIERGLGLTWDRTYYYVYPDGTSTLRQLTDEEKATIEENIEETYKIYMMLKT